MDRWLEGVAKSTLHPGWRLWADLVQPRPALLLRRPVAEKGREEGYHQKTCIKTASMSIWGGQQGRSAESNAKTIKPISEEAAATRPAQTPHACAAMRRSKGGLLKPAGALRRLDVGSLGCQAHKGILATVHMHHPRRILTTHYSASAQNVHAAEGSLLHRLVDVQARPAPCNSARNSNRRSSSNGSSDSNLTCVCNTTCRCLANSNSSTGSVLLDGAASEGLGCLAVERPAVAAESVAGEVLMGANLAPPAPAALPPPPGCCCCCPHVSSGLLGACGVLVVGVEAVVRSLGVALLTAPCGAMHSIMGLLCWW